MKKTDRIGGWKMFDIVKVSPKLKARSAARELAMHIARFSDPDGTGAWPSIKLLAECMNYKKGPDGEPTKKTRRLMRAALAVLEGKGLVQLEPVCNCSEEKRQLNPHPNNLQHYRLNVALFQAVEPVVDGAAEVPESGTHGPRPVPDQAPEAANQVPDQAPAQVPDQAPGKYRSKYRRTETQVTRTEICSWRKSATTASSHSRAAPLPVLDADLFTTLDTDLFSHYAAAQKLCPTFSDNTVFGRFDNGDD